MEKYNQEIEAYLNVLWEALKPDYSRFVELLKSGTVEYHREMAPHFPFWRSKNHPEDVEALQREFSSAMFEYFSPPDLDHEPVIHAGPGEGWPLDTIECLAFLETKAEPIAGFIVLNRFLRSDTFKTMTL